MSVNEKSFGKKGRQLREIARLEKFMHPGEMSAELQRINDIRYNANTEETNLLYAYTRKMFEYQSAQKKIALIKRNINPARKKLFNLSKERDRQEDAAHLDVLFEMNKD